MQSRIYIVKNIYQYQIVKGHWQEFAARKQ